MTVLKAVTLILISGTILFLACIFLLHVLGLAEFPFLGC